MEAIYRDYSPQGVEFRYIYKALAHPETNGYVTPFTLQERLMHVKEAQRTLASQFTWLCDTMSNDLKHALGDAPNSEFIIDPQGKVVRRRAWSNPKQLRKDLEDLIGPIENPTKASDIQLGKVRAAKVAPRGIVPPVKVASRMLALQIKPKESPSPYYAKLRAEADENVLRSGKGKLYLGFHMDPLYHVHWNNLVAPVRYELKAPEGVIVSPASGEGPKVEEPSDSDPREFLLDIEMGQAKGPLELTVKYFACNEQEGWCKPVTQRYTILMQVDPDGGWVGKRYRVRRRQGAQLAQQGNGKTPPAPQSDRRPAPNRFIQRFKSNDKNGDGKITKDEASNQLKRFFDRVDANRDGVIDEAELKKMAERFRGGRPPANRPPQRRRRGQAAAPVPKGVTFTADIAYRKGNEKWRLDLAMPEELGKAPRPAIVFVHGGGWRGGDKGTNQWRRLPLEYAAKGYVCISVNYRLTDQAPFPACVEDVKCAVRWLRANAKKYNLDPQKIGAYGNSAGAHLVSMLGLVGADAHLEGGGLYQDQSSLVQAVCCSATPTDFMNWRGRGDNAFLKRGLLRGPDDTFAARAKKASPITYAKSSAPPFLVIHGAKDRTVPIGQGDRFVEALKKSGAKDVTYMRYEDAGHGVFGQHSSETHPAMEKFFARTLGPGRDTAVPTGE